MGEVCAVRGLPGCFEPPVVAIGTQWLALYKSNFSQAKLSSGLGVTSTPDTRSSQRKWPFTTCCLRLVTLRFLDVLGLVVIGDLALFPEARPCQSTTLVLYLKPLP